MQFHLDDVYGGRADVDGEQERFHDVGVELTVHVPKELPAAPRLQSVNDIHRIGQDCEGDVGVSVFSRQPHSH
eukprot:3457687-Rhodomonas_salina.1